MGRDRPSAGSIRLRRDGRWEARVTLTDPDGRRIRRSLLARSRPEVEAKLRAALDAEARGLPATDARLRLAEHLTDWLENVRPRVRPRTYQSYESVVRVHLIPALGHVPLIRLTPQQVQTMLNRQSAGGASPRTVAISRDVLRLALHQAERWGQLGRNVARLVDPPRVVRHEIRPLAPAEVRRFLDAIAGTPDEALYLTAIGLGLRQGELLGLAWSDVDLEAGTLRVRHALQRIDGVARLVEPKSVTSRRTVALPAVVADALRQHRRRQLERRLAAGDRWRAEDWDLVFCSATGTPLDGPNVNKRFQRLIADLGLPRQRFHDLRHACASLLLVQGVAPRVVMETLGHSQISLTMNTYSHVMPALGRDAAARMDELLAARSSAG